MQNKNENNLVFVLLNNRRSIFKLSLSMKEVRITLKSTNLETCHFEVKYCRLNVRVGRYGKVGFEAEACMYFSCTKTEKETF